MNVRRSSFIASSPLFMKLKKVKKPTPTTVVRSRKSLPHPEERGRHTYYIIKLKILAIIQR